MITPTEYIFEVSFVCPVCKETQYFSGTINDILSVLNEIGWPICAECGDDMDFEVI